MPSSTLDSLSVQGGGLRKLHSSTARTEFARAIK